MRRAAKHTKSPRAAVPTVADLQAELRGHGLRSTGPRVAVLAYLGKATAPLSHTEIHDALAGRGFDRVTVYRNLMDLAEAGILVRSDLGDHVWRFERRDAKRPGNDAGHPHFVCTDCGEVSCLPERAVEVRAATGAPRALRTSQVEVQIKGRCDDCA
jgi:Fur family ferric uptake transcriptional regulator